MEIPREFRKNESIDHIHAPILFGQRRIRYRSDILSEEFDLIDRFHSISFSMYLPEQFPSEYLRLIIPLRII